MTFFLFQLHAASSLSAVASVEAADPSSLPHQKDEAPVSQILSESLASMQRGWRGGDVDQHERGSQRASAGGHQARGQTSELG